MQFQKACKVSRRNFVSYFVGASKMWMTPNALASLCIKSSEAFFNEFQSVRRFLGGTLSDASGLSSPTNFQEKLSEAGPQKFCQ